MRIISWNINSVRLRMDMLKKIVKRFKPDILCLQETKCPNDLFPHQDFYDMGFRYSFAYGIKGYNGVSIASKINSTKNLSKIINYLIQFEKIIDNIVEINSFEWMRKEKFLLENGIYQ